MHFRLLGPLEVHDDGSVLGIGGVRQRAVLAALLTRVNETATVPYLASAVWERPPASPASNLRTYVAGLRRVLGADRLLTRPAGYTLVTGPGELDLAVFGDLTADGDRAAESGDLPTAVTRYDEALALWRGSPAEDLQVGSVLRNELASLSERRLSVLERCFDAKLALCRYAEVIGELRKAVGEHPLRERFWEQLLHALHHSGRRGEALETYQVVYRLLDTELGVVPGPGLRHLHAVLLTDEPERVRRVADRRPRQLPPGVDHFVGRAGELRALGEAVRAEVEVLPVVAISGNPGVGKTAFVIRAGHALASDFPDGQLFADLRGADPNPCQPTDVLGYFLRDLGVAGVDLPTTLDGRSALLRDLLADRRMLLVLDNAASEEQVRPLLPGHPGCCVLITSRRRLTGLDTGKRVRLDPLATTESERLLRDLAGDTLRENESVPLIAHLCGGLPLALRIIGTKLRSLRSLSPGMLTLRLADENHRLDQLVGGDREVRASFLLSYDGLEPVEQRAFRLFATLPSHGFAPWAAAVVLGEPLPGAERLLERLLEANLLEYVAVPGSGVRYRFHDLIRLFGTEKAEQDCDEPERSAARLRVLDAYIHIARHADTALGFGGLPEFEPPPLDLGDPDLVPTLVADPARWLDEEHTGLLEVFHRAVADGLDRQVCELGASLGAYLELRGQWDELVNVLDPGIAAARRLGSPYWVAHGLFARALVAREQRDFDQCERLFRECVAVLPEAGDKRLTVVVSISVGVWHRLRGRLDKAKAIFTDCLRMLESVADPRWRAYALRELGIVHRYQGEWDRAGDCLTMACAEFDRLGDRRWWAAAQRELGVVRREQGDHATARELLSSSRNTFRELGDHRREAGAWRSLAYLALAEDDLPAARGYALRSRDLFALTLDSNGAAQTDVCLAEVSLAEGETDSAVELLQRGAAVFRRLADPRWLARVERLLTGLGRGTRDPGAAPEAPATAAGAGCAAPPGRAR